MWHDVYQEESLHQLYINIEGHSINKVNKTIFFVFIDNKLDLKEHISYIVEKIVNG